ncbi:hypothetical protein FPF71_12550 [Algibacter amylolyticus]|uniref:DUF3379 domain-containing protein n=1 Tax=Algibacter amylolyticus TaxID=1608400 RepID=A0A5M7B548_9FLAO|nr:hypothetical protein [Algibacter amylolyticus]KAA5823528.1 hypothetical protein F2B50_12550 [Algibacter amylolyticus]MBB5267681.1 hypothetical protein [Algibacter amylolyticus]TSJ74016.1 hypothetical protein FPF71_12550 [Algibacter amylolyticus]
MVLNNIEKLLEKYENGESSLKEEQQLKNYFSQETVAPHLEVYKPMFAYFLVNKQEQFTKDVPLKTTRKYNYKWISVAAVAVLMLGFYFGTTLGQGDLGTYEDPELAFNEFSKSMEMISSKFNKGAATVSYLNEVSKGTSTLGYLNEVENTTSIIFKTY